MPADLSLGEGGQAVLPEERVPSVEQGTADAGSSTIPAWPFGLALLAAALWFAFRRRKAGAPHAGARDPGHEEQARSAPEPGPSAPPVLPPAPAEEPEAILPTPPDRARSSEAHPALRVKIAEPVQAIPEPVPPLLERPVVTRYDAFGRPIAAKAEPPRPKPASRPRARIVRYDAMGLPIRD